MKSVAFSGSRSLVGNRYNLCYNIARMCADAGYSVITGCAKGADAAVRSAVPEATIFSASNFGSGKSSFARRSIEMIRSLPPESILVAFPDKSCPVKILPNASASKCFCGSGSGTWATIAYAAGLGHTIYLYGDVPTWGIWSPVSSGIFSGSFLFSPSSSQSCLF